MAVTSAKWSYSYSLDLGNQLAFTTGCNLLQSPDLYFVIFFAFFFCKTQQKWLTDKMDLHLRPHGSFNGSIIHLVTLLTCLTTVIKTIIKIESSHIMPQLMTATATEISVPVVIVRQGLPVCV